MLDIAVLAEFISVYATVNNGVLLDDIEPLVLEHCIGQTRLVEVDVETVPNIILLTILVYTMLFPFVPTSLPEYSVVPTNDSVLGCVNEVIVGGKMPVVNVTEAEAALYVVANAVLLTCAVILYVDSGYKEDNVNGLLVATFDSGDSKVACVIDTK